MPEKDSAEKAVRDIRRRDGTRRPSAQKKRDGLRFCEHPALLNCISGDLNRSTQHRRNTAPPGFELQGLAGPLVEVVRRLV